MNRFDFFKEGIRNIKTVGTITRSSRFLCDKIINYSQIHKAKVIVELGAGDGVLTKRILDRMPDDCLLIAFEINEKFTKILEDIEDKRLIVAADSAENLFSHMETHGVRSVDVVYSAIPFSVLPDKLSRDIVGTAKEALRPDGEYLQIHYSLMEKKLYEGIFGNVEIHFQPLNIPPAFILKSVKA